MKKVLMALSLMVVGRVYAGLSGSSFNGIPYFRTTDTIRSSNTVTIGTNNVTVLVATGPIFLADIQITSGNTGGWFRFFDSTTAADIKSTSTLYDCSSSQNYFQVLKPVTSGFMLATSSCVATIRWDWMYTIPVGQENRGR